jgi:hypothetical protein
MIKLVEYVDPFGRNPFVACRRRLDDVTRARQQMDIEAAQERWADYKRRSKKGER